MFKFDELKKYTQNNDFKEDLYLYSSNCVIINNDTINSMNLLCEIKSLQETYMQELSNYDFLFFFQNDGEFVGERAIFRRQKEDNIVILECIYCKDLSTIITYIKSCISHEIKLCEYKNSESLNLREKKIFIYTPTILNLNIQKSVVRDFDVLGNRLLTELQEYVYKIYVDSEFNPLMI